MSTRTSRLTSLRRTITRIDESVFSRLTKRLHTGGENLVGTQLHPKEARNDSARPDWYQATHRADS